MKPGSKKSLYLLVAAALMAGTAAADEKEDRFQWSTVVNNNDMMPPLGIRNFNSYNQPSVNLNGVVVIRARSRGGPPLGPPTHGIYVRDMSAEGNEIRMVLDKTTLVPGPNNLNSTFVETPSFPRIDMSSDTIATRGNHQPVSGLEADPAAVAGDRAGIAFWIPGGTGIRRHHVRSVPRRAVGDGWQYDRLQG